MLTPFTSRQSSTVISVNGLDARIPALLTSMSTRPNSSMADPTIR